MELHVVRSLCQEATRWYLSHLDPLVSHDENVANYLRGPVLALTVRILYPSPPEDVLVNLSTKAEANTNITLKSASSPTASNKPQDWREFLKQNPASEQESSAIWSKKDQDAYEALGRRTKARMDAFLRGCALAISQSNSKPSVQKSLKHARTMAKLGGSGQRVEDMSIAEGLAGFQPPRKNGKFPSPMASPVLKSLSANGSHLLRQISASSAKKLPQIGEEELLVRLELYLRTLNRVHSSGQECVVALEAPKVLKARAKIIVRAFVATVGCVQRLSPVLTELLHSLTQELLAFETLGEELVKVIRRVVMEYEHQTSFASLAFLSSPEASAENRLTPLVLSYLKYIQSNHSNLESDAELEHMLREVIHPKLRHMFKTIEFNSIGHLLEVCQGLRSELQNIQLVPPNVDCVDLTQNPQALRQAIRDLQREIITVNGHVLPPVTSRKDLVYLLSQTLNSRALTSEPPKKRKPRVLDVRRTESCPSMVSLEMGRHRFDSDDFLSSGNEGDTDGSKSGPKNPRGSSGGLDDKRRHRKRNFHLSTIDVLTRRLLIAASRTGMGGDAFFVVRDLFGGEEVEVVPATQVPPQAGHVGRQGSIEIVVRLASVTIKCHGTFDVYPKSLVGSCEPLIQLHTTTTETIGLREVRAHGSSSDDGVHDDCGSSGEEETGTSIMIVQERKTETSGLRTLSIRPALYERVEVWNTPS